MWRFSGFLVLAIFFSLAMPFFSRGQIPQLEKAKTKNEDKSKPTDVSQDAPTLGPVARFSNEQQRKQRSPDYQGIESLAFSPNGKFIASCDGLEVLLWDV